MLTLAIMEAATVEGVMETLDAGLKDGILFNHFHASAALCQLAHKIRDLRRDDSSLSEYNELISETRRVLTSREDLERTSSNILWATAVLYRRLPRVRDLIDDLIFVISEVAVTMQAQGVANSFWAIATLRQEEPRLKQLLPVLLNRCPEVARSFLVQHVSNIMWAVQVLQLKGAESNRVFEVLQEQVGSRLLPEIKRAQNFGQIAWGLSGFRSVDAALMAKMATLVPEVSVPWRIVDAARSLPQIALAFAVLRHWDHPMMVEVARRADPMWKHLTPWGVCALTLAFREFYPELEDGLAGAWKGRGIISGSKITWEKGRVGLLTLVEPGIMQIEVKGQTYTGTLASDGKAIQWNDGDVWVRDARPFEPLQSRLRKQLKKLGIEHKLEHCLLGPERWSDRD